VAAAQGFLLSEAQVGSAGPLTSITHPRCIEQITIDTNLRYCNANDKIPNFRPFNAARGGHLHPPPVAATGNRAVFRKSHQL